MWRKRTGDAADLVKVVGFVLVAFIVVGLIFWVMGGFSGILTTATNGVNTQLNTAAGKAQNALQSGVNALP